MDERQDRRGRSEAATDMAPEPFAGWTPRRVITATLIVLAIAAGFWLVFRFHTTVFLFLVAVMLGIATKPAVAWLQKRGIRPQIGVILIYLALFGVLALFLLLVVPLLADQVTAMVEKLPEHYRNLRQGLILSDNRLIQRLALGLPMTITVAMPAAGGASAGVSATAAPEMSQVLPIVGRAVQGIFILIAILVLAFFWVQEGEVLVRRLLRLLPPDKREPARSLYTELEGKVGAYFRGQLILCGVVGVLSLIGYLIIGLPYAIGLALIMAVAEAIPMIGPTLGAIPALLVALTAAPDKVVWALAVVFVVQMAENNLLVPRIMDRSVGVNPIITILGITAFGALFGVVGALLAVPLSAMVQIIAYRVMFRAPAQIEVGRTRASALRLATQELIQDVRKSSRGDRDDAQNVDPAVSQAEELLETIAQDLDRILAGAEVQPS